MTNKEIEELGRQEYAKWRAEKNKINYLTAQELEELNYISMVKHREYRKINGVDFSGVLKPSRHYEHPEVDLGEY